MLRKQLLLAKLRAHFRPLTVVDSTYGQGYFHLNIPLFECLEWTLDLVFAGWASDLLMFIW